MTDQTPITDESFIDLCEQMLAHGGEWRVVMSKEGISMHYRRRWYSLSERQANVMWKCIPRKVSADGENLNEEKGK